MEAQYTALIRRLPLTDKTLANDTVLLDLKLHSHDGTQTELDEKWDLTSQEGLEVRSAWMGNPESRENLSISLRFGFADLDFTVGIDLLHLELASEEMIEALINSERLLLETPADGDTRTVVSVPTPQAQDDSLTEVLRLRRA